MRMGNNIQDLYKAIIIVVKNVKLKEYKVKLCNYESHWRFIYFSFEFTKVEQRSVHLDKNQVKLRINLVKN